jgi:hypothetical protein
MGMSTNVLQLSFHAEAVRLMTAAYVLTGLRVKKTDLSSIYRGVGLMTESTAYDEAVEEGELRHSSARPTRPPRMR